MKPTIIYLVHHEQVLDGATDNETFAYKKEEDALKIAKQLIDTIRADWANECVEENDDAFSAWREGQYNEFHCEVYVQPTILH